ncbi:3-galactosyl-N-acetylglucosaminide 4-alpha-L-fucosyltransferase FUT3-like [Hyalella azteca]|uniref:Fucosyltransferase n=1 Tax=Hyalella azteca TaxID=294128 RepID=A0A979FHB2_HYAAZ|nr:3-galactosyl-N-acetylglucosaminide 4-alpha-L-fucosyltransferase FUT3-like [Hyalella azteca]
MATPGHHKKANQAQLDVGNVSTVVEVKVAGGQYRVYNKLMNLTSSDLHDCTVSNCRVTLKDDDLLGADAVLFYLNLVVEPPVDVPRDPGQLWVWFTDENPNNVLGAARDRVLSHYNGLFNWSMNYKMDSSVPVPYGRTVYLSEDERLDKVEDYYKLKLKNFTIMNSHCDGFNGRFNYIYELQKFIFIDFYGKCGTLQCEGRYWMSCEKLRDYKFYFAFESTNCDEYMTEKVWWNALHMGAVPVVMGSPKLNYETFLPPGSFIHVDDFNIPADLARYLKYLLDHPAKYQQYHDWRRRYRVLNEHGYMGAPTREHFYDSERQCHNP